MFLSFVLRSVLLDDRYLPLRFSKYILRSLWPDLLNLWVKLRHLLLVGSLLLTALGWAHLPVFI